MTEKERFILAEQFNGLQGVTFVKDDCADVDTYYTVDGTVDLLNQLSEENEQLKKGMIGVVDRYIKNVECNPPSSARTYIKIKGALVNIREDLRNLIGDVE